MNKYMHDQTNAAKPRLIVLSDMWGVRHSKWLDTYALLLEPHFDIKFYDSCDLGKVDSSVKDEILLHEQFIKGGIDLAVETLLKIEPEKVHVLAFSVGGTIAWKAGLSGLQLQNLLAVSSTRLRYETAKPNCDISLYYGDSDNFKPDESWCRTMNLQGVNIEKGGHHIYSDENIARRICSNLIRWKK